MAPSEKTVLRRIQRAGQRQRMREALQRAADVDPDVAVPKVASSTHSEPVNEEPVHEPQVSVEPPVAQDAIRKVAINTFVEAVLTHAPQSKTMSAEDFVEKICQLVDQYRASLEPPARARLDTQPIMHAEVSPNGKLTVEKQVQTDEIYHDIDDSAVPSMRHPTEQRAYTVKNTFIDVVPANYEVAPSVKAMFSTWPEDKQTSADDEMLCSASTGSCCSRQDDSQLEAGEITDDSREFEEGELPDEEEAFYEQSMVAHCHHIFPDTWHTLEEKPQVLDLCSSIFGNVGGEHIHETNENPCNLDKQTQGLKDFLRDALPGFQVAYGYEGKHTSDGLHARRWRKDVLEKNVKLDHACSNALRALVQT